MPSTHRRGGQRRKSLVSLGLRGSCVPTGEVGRCKCWLTDQLCPCSLGTSNYHLYTGSSDTAGQLCGVSGLNLPPECMAREGGEAGGVSVREPGCKRSGLRRSPKGARALRADCHPREQSVHRSNRRGNMKIARFHRSAAWMQCELFHKAKLAGLEPLVEIQLHSAHHRSRTFRVDVLLLKAGKPVLACECKPDGASDSWEALATRQAKAYAGCGLKTKLVKSIADIDSAISFALSDECRV